MIEEMLLKIKKNLPLEVERANINWDVFNLYGRKWAFAAVCGWRVVSKKKLIKGCYDTGIEKFEEEIKGRKIIDVTYQENTLIIDPVFTLSDETMIEIFSTDTFEPWTFRIEDENFYFYTATPGEPDAFEKKN